MSSFSKTKILLIALAAVILLLAVCIAVSVVTDPYDCKMLENVTIGGLDVSGMGLFDAWSAVKDAAEESLLSQNLEVKLPEKTLSLSPEEAGLKLSSLKAVWKAYRYGRSEENPAGDGYALGLAPYLKVKEEVIRGVLTAYAQEFDTTLTQYSCTLEGDAPDLSVQGYDPDLSVQGYDPEAPCQTLVLTLGVPELHLDVDGVYGEIIGLYDRAFAAAAEGNYGIAPEVTPDALPDAPDWETLYGQYSIEAVDDSLDMEAYCPIPGSYGYHFDLEKAKALAAAAEFGEAVTIPMVCVEPEILGEEVYFRDVLGTCETKHNSDELRTTNLRLVCQILNGHIIQPGESFSYNGTVGERTPERGFQPAPAYSGNRLIKDYGGGVCQGSTTLYNCLLLADMEVTDRVCHGITVSYVPRGLDAAVNWATKTDLAFTNNSHFPVMIQAEVSDGYVKMKLLGTDEKDYYIKMESTSGEDDVAIYANSYKCKYDKETDELISRELEARSTYYKNLG